MADLSYTVEVGGTEKLGQLAAGITAVTQALDSSKDNARKLAEFKKALGDMGGASAGLNSLERELQKLNNTFKEKLDGLASTLKREMAELRGVTATGSAGIAAEFSKGFENLAAKSTPRIKQATSTVKQAVAGHYNELGMFISNEQAKLAANAAKSTGLSNALALGANTAGSGARNAKTFTGAIPQPQDIAQVKALSSSFQKLTIDGNDVHSAMRGLASGFNLLWLTWGNLLPLFAGAAISNGFMKTAKEGLKVTQTLGTIAYLGENTAAEMQSLTGELVRMGNEGIYGPVAIAEAMQTLSLAGLKANEILAVTGTVMGFSVAGATDIKTAADVLVSVTTAFGTGAAGFSRSADIIMRAAADSKASVESFGEAMKQASVVGEQYGAKQEDVALLIQYMANLGIQGTAAGTAVRNMYADISGRSGPARKAMKELGLDFRDANGHVVGLKEQAGQLLAVLSKYDGKSQANIIQAIYGERGAKAAIEMLVKAKTYILENGKLTSQLEIDQRKLENAYGDAAIAAVKMGTTTENAFKAAGATLETTLFGAFTAMEPQLYAVAVALREAFGSKDLQDSLSKLVSGVADIAKYVAENIQMIVSAGLAYGAYKLAIVGVTLAYGLYQNVLNTINAAKAVNLARTTAQAVGELELGAALGVRTAAEIATAKATAASAAANAGRLTVVGSLAKAIPFVGTAITLAGLAWMGYDMWASRSANTMADLSGQKTDDMIAALDKENKHLAAVNIERERGLGLLEAEARVKANNAKADISVGGMTKLSALQSEIDVLQSSRDKAQASYGSNTPGETPHDIQVMDLQLARKRVEMRKAGEEERVRQVALAKVEEERSDHAIHVSVLNQRDRDKELADQKKLMSEYTKLYGTGKQTWEQSTGKDGHSGPRENYYDDKALQNIEKQSAAELSLIKSKYDEEKAIQDNAYKNLLIGQADYAAQTTFSAAKFEQDSINSLQNSSAKYMEEYAATYAEISMLRDKALSKNDTQGADKLEADLEKLRNAAVTNAEKTAIDIEKIQNDSNKRILTARQDLQGEVLKLAKADEEYWTKSKQETDKVESLQKVAEQYRYINTSVFSTATAEKAYAEAVAESNNKHEAQLANLRKEIKLRLDAITALRAYIQAQALASIADPSLAGPLNVAAAELQVHEASVKGLQETLANAVAEGTADGARRGALAYKAEMDAKAAYMTDGIADALMTSFEEGGKAGGKKFRKLIEDELLRKPFMSVVKMLIQPIMGQMLGSLFGMGGGVAAGGGVMGGLGMVGQGLGLYSGLTSGTGMLGTVGNWLGLGAAGGAVGAGAWGGAAVAGSYAAPGIGAVGSLGGAGASTGAMGALGAIPGWGWALAGLALLGPSLFGHTLKDSGIQGTFGGDKGFDGRTYKFYEGGLFSSDKTTYGALDEAVRKTLGDTFTAMKTQVTDFATALGLSTDKLKGFTSDVKISLKGLSDTDAQKKIQEALATANNDLAQQVIGTWVTTTQEVTRQVQSTAAEMEAGANSTHGVTSSETTSKYTPSEFAKEGEKAIDTLTRLATSLTAVNQVFDTLGYTLLEASLKGGDFASKIIEAFGDVEKFTAATSSYYQNFYSDAERKAIAQRQFDAEMQKLGLTTPKTREEFRKLVEAQDLTTEAGRKMFAALLNLSPLFAEITQSAEDALKNSLDAAYSALEASVAAANKLLEEQKATAQDLVNSWKAIYDAAKQGAEDLFGEVSSTAAGAAARGMIFIERAVTDARNGVIPDQGQFGTAISDARNGLVSSNYASQFELDRDRLVVANHLAEIQEAAGKQMTAAEQTVERLDKQIRQNQQILDYWREQIDIANGTYKATLSITEAIDALKKLLFPDKKPVDAGAPGGASWGGGSGSAAPTAPPSKYSRVTGLGTSIGYVPVIDKAEIDKLDTLAPIYHSFDGTGDLRGLLESFKAAGGRMSDLEVLSGFFQNDWIRAAEAVGIPAFSRGTNYVNEDMLAVIHKGEAVIPAAYNNNNNNNNSNNSEIDRAILIQLAQDIRSIKESTRQHADQFDKVTAGGNAILTETA